MKKIIPVLVMSCLTAMSAPPRFTHIQGDDGSILATIDGETGKIDYKKDCEDVMPTVLAFLQNTVRRHQKQKLTLKNGVAKKKVKRAKKPKK